MEILSRIGEYVAENSGPVSEWAAIAAAVVAVVTLGKMAKDSAAATRPYLYMHVEPDRYGTKALVKVKNYGSTQAKNVHFTFPDDFAPGEPGTGNLAGYVREQLSGGAFETWPPGYEITNVYRLAKPEADEYTPPERVVAKVRYRRSGSLFRYRDRFVLDTRPINYQRFERNDRDVEQRLKVANKALDRISRATQSIAGRLLED